MEKCEGWIRPCTMYVKKQQGQLVDVICQANGKKSTVLQKLWRRQMGSQCIEIQIFVRFMKSSELCSLSP